jgi:pyruvate dehydrogenase complex dehydrogenase (E1) component
MSMMGDLDLDLDLTETAEWLDALGAVQQHRGGGRSNYLINKLVDQGRRVRAALAERAGDHPA